MPHGSRVVFVEVVQIEMVIQVIPRYFIPVAQQTVGLLGNETGVVYIGRQCNVDGGEIFTDSPVVEGAHCFFNVLDAYVIPEKGKASVRRRGWGEEGMVIDASDNAQAIF